MGVEIFSIVCVCVIVFVFLFYGCYSDLWPLCMCVGGMGDENEFVIKTFRNVGGKSREEGDPQTQALSARLSTNTLWLMRKLLERMKSFKMADSNQQSVSEDVVTVTFSGEQPLASYDTHLFSVLKVITQ